MLIPHNSAPFWANFLVIWSRTYIGKTCIQNKYIHQNINLKLTSKH
jgi:hypothetical protein